MMPDVFMEVCVCVCLNPAVCVPAHTPDVGGTGVTDVSLTVM